MYYPIGDIHGRFDLLKGLYAMVLEEIECNPDYAYGDTIVFLGDYIDRGPQTKDVLDFLMKLEDTDTIKHKFLMGNHEEFMVHCATTPNDQRTFDMWHYHGGQQTLKAFGVGQKEMYEGALDEYVQWMMQLPLMAWDYDYVFVHAAVNTGKPLDKQNRDYCLWAFETYEAIYRNYNKIVVHGHITRKVGKKFDTKPYIDIPNNRIWMEVGANFNNGLAAVALPQPYHTDEEIKVLHYRV